MDKVKELVGGGSAINGPTPSSSILDTTFSYHPVFTRPGQSQGLLEKHLRD